MIAKKILTSIIFSFLFIVILGYIDYELLSPLLPFPDDICYYHENEAPIWIKLFYLDSMEHIEPPYSGLHMTTLLLTSIGLGYVTANRLIKK